LVADFTVASSKGKILLRALGGSLKDTVLDLANANGSVIFTNDNWQDMQKDQIEATGLAPTNVNDSAIIANLDPGSYLAIVRTKKKGGTATVEVLSLP
jgi:hypothetical protein